MKYDSDEYRALQATRRAAGLLIDPATAETQTRFAYMFDPYNDGLELTDEMDVVGREEFARAPGSTEWIHHRDCPDAIRAALLRRFG
jgi:hypothetical protein